MRKTTKGVSPGLIPGVGNGFWVYMPYLDQIIEECDNPRTATGVYIALCRHASDMQSLSFRASECYVGSRAGISKKAARMALSELKRIGLVMAEPPSGRWRVPKITLLGKARL